MAYTGMGMRTIHRFTFPTAERFTENPTMAGYYRQSYESLEDALDDAGMIVKEVGTSPAGYRRMVPYCELWTHDKLGNLIKIATIKWSDIHKECSVDYLVYSNCHPFDDVGDIANLESWLKERDESILRSLTNTTASESQPDDER